MSWEKEIVELRQRQALAQAMGGEDKVARQHKAGRLTVRERIEALLDPGSFREIGSISGVAGYDEAGALSTFTPTNFVFGRGRIAQRAVVVAGDDFTVRGGASDASIIEKLVAAEQMAHELRLPMVRLVEGSGGGGSVKSLEALGYTYVPYLPGWEFMARNLATVPVVSLGLGPIAGFGAAQDNPRARVELLAAEDRQVREVGDNLVFVVDAPIGEAEPQAINRLDVGADRPSLCSLRLEIEILAGQCNADDGAPRGVRVVLHEQVVGVAVDLRDRRGAERRSVARP